MTYYKLRKASSVLENNDFKTNSKDYNSFVLSITCLVGKVVL
jgi:hypothetical protein